MYFDDCSDNISNEELKNRFSDWLFEKSLSNFKVLNGFEIIRTFGKHYFGNDLSMDKSEYHVFISDKKYLIKVIEIWISTFDLSFDDYKIFFENYCNNLLKENNNNLKFSFPNVYLSFQNDVIKPNFIINKSAIIQDELRTLFINTINKNKNELKAQKKAQNEAARIYTCKKCNVILKKEAIRNSKKFGVIWEKCLKENIREYRKEFKKRFPEKIKAEKKKYKKERIARDDAFKILNRMRNRIILVLQGKRKLESSLQLLGCSPDFLKSYLESKFIEGMTWENYGVKGWHVDHIIPCSSFDFTKLEDQKKNVSIIQICSLFGGMKILENRTKYYKAPFLTSYHTGNTLKACFD